MPNKSIYLPGSKGLVPDAAVRGGFLFSGGVAGRDASGGLPETHEEQAALAYDRVGAILDQAGYSWPEIGHWFIWAPDRHSRIAPINPHWEQHFPDPRSRPARHALARQLDLGVQYRIEIIGVKDASRTSYEINDRVYHTGGSATPGFMPFGTTMGDILFTGPTYGMYSATRKMGETPLKQAELCFSCNQELYAMTGHTLDNLAQMFVWYHDEDTRKAAIDFTGAMFPDPNDRPAIHYIYSQLPYWNDPEVMGQFLVQYDIIGVRGGRRRLVQPAGVRTMDGAPAGVAIGELLFKSVCLALDLSGSLEAQTRQAFQAVRQVAEAGGFGLSDTGHVYVWYASHDARETVDKVWGEVFPNPDDRPARHCVVADLPAGALIGVDATAAR